MKTFHDAISHSSRVYGQQFKGPVWKKPDGVKREMEDANPLGVKAPGAPGTRSPKWMCITYSILHAPQRCDNRRPTFFDHEEYVEVKIKYEQD